MHHWMYKRKFYFWVFYTFFLSKVKIIITTKIFRIILHFYSIFEKSDYFCDCLFDDSINNKLAYEGYCNKKCNATCTSNCDLCGSNDGFFASKYMLSSSKTLKPIVKITKVLNRPTKSVLNYNSRYIIKLFIFYKLQKIKFLSIWSIKRVKR